MIRHVHGPAGEKVISTEPYHDIMTGWIGIAITTRVFGPEPHAYVAHLPAGVALDLAENIRKTVEELK